MRKHSSKTSAITCSMLHDAIPKMLYMQWHSDADERHKKGQKQIRCPACGKFVWDEQYHHFPPTPITKHLGGKHYEIIGWTEPKKVREPKPTKKLPPNLKRKR